LDVTTTLISGANRGLGFEVAGSSWRPAIKSAFDEVVVPRSPYLVFEVDLVGQDCPAFLAGPEWLHEDHHAHDYPGLV
jgi:hypothetical protein